MKKINFLFSIIFLIAFALGGFYDFIVCIISAILALNILIKYLKNKKINVKINSIFILICILILGSIVTCFFAVDRSIAIFGVFRNLAILLFYLNLCQYEEKEIKSAFLAIPIAGIAMFFISIIMYFIPPVRNFVFSEGNRLTGFFQYANTFALFLLLGIIILVFSKEISNKLKLLFSILLFIAILLTGSRITFFLAIINIFVIFFTIVEKKYKKYYLLSFTAIILIAIAIALATNNFQNIGRFLTAEITSSSLLGRFVYFKDALELILSNPFGLGYMGYSYCYKEVQTAMYSVKFVHNDVLQIALDYGILISLIVFIYLIEKIISFLKAYLKSKKEEKNNLLRNFLLLSTMLIHMLFEFDLEFISIIFILVLIISEELLFNNEKNSKLKNTKISKMLNTSFELKKSILVTVFILVILITNVYLGLGSFANYIGNYDLSLSILPGFTEAKLKKMEYNFSENNINTANELADEILEKNKYIVEAYLVKASYCLENKEYDKALEFSKKAISLDKYNMEEYDNYILILSQIINEKIIKEDYNEVNIYINEVLNVENMLETLKNNTSDLSKYFIDKPSFELSEKSKEYIEVLKNNKIVEY